MTQKSGTLSIRCLFGFHDYRYVGEQQRPFREGPRNWGYYGWNVECARCGKTGWWVDARQWNRSRAR